MDMAQNILPSRYLTKERFAVSTLFLLNGLYIGSWAAKIPTFAERLGLSPADMGIMVLIFGIGSVVLMPVAGSQIARLGSARASKIATILMLPTLLACTFAPNVWSAAIALFLFGGLTGCMDVSMNANAVETEKAMRRSIMSSCHAFWSVGTFLGASAGGWLIANIGIGPHALLASILGCLLLAAAWPRLLLDPPQKQDKPEGRKLSLPLSPLPWLLGIMALFSMIPEGAVLDWSALYLRDELGAPLAISTLAFGAFSLTMAIMRFAGDFVRDRFGAVNTFRLCTTIAILGIVAAGLAPNEYVAIGGFALAGVGVSNMVPIAFSAAGNVPGLAQGVALSVTTFMGYSGMLFAPSIIGFLAEHTSFSTVYLALPVFLLGVLALSGFARYADTVKDGAH